MDVDSEEGTTKSTTIERRSTKAITQTVSFSQSLATDSIELTSKSVSTSTDKIETIMTSVTEGTVDVDCRSVHKHTVRYQMIGSKLLAIKQY